MKIKKIFETTKSSLRSLSKKDIAVCLAVACVVIILAFGSANIRGNDKSAQSNTPASVNEHSTEFEQRLSEILSKIDGAGNVSILINRRDSSDEIIGAVILFEGTDIPETRIKLQLAAQTALGVEAAKIKIFAMKA